MPSKRHLGLFGATAVGVGAIVGGGILALAGVAFSNAGPGALLAFALNGGIAFLTAASFAELAVRFPHSGGTYTYAKRVLSIEVAFVVGWVVWFASVVAGVLYALGFAVFAAEGAARLLQSFGLDPTWLGRSTLHVALALAATLYYAVALSRRSGGGGNAATIGKVVVFAILLGGGVVAVLRGHPLGRFDPFLPHGLTGVVQAMGYTFIALQGFDLIAAVGGEVRDPARNLPRAMFLSLAIALVIYLPLLALIVAVGVGPEGDVASVAAADPAGLVATAAERFLGPVGYWLVIGAGVLSMLSALHANLLGASRVAFAMARDRTLPRALGRMRGASGTPAIAVMATATMLAIVVLVVSDVSAAGAASSLIFLISFAMVHWAAILARRRSGDRRLPVLPVAGAALCLALAVFQSFAVREAGSVVIFWLAVGAVLYLTTLASGARLADASAEARDPDLARLRGRSPLVLVPIANPASAASLAGVAATVRTPGVGRVLLHSVVPLPEGVPDENDPALRDAQTILGDALLRGFERAVPAETLFTVAADPWAEIARVARLHRCQTIVLGSPRVFDPGTEAQIASLLARVDAQAVVLRAPRRWRIAQVRSVLVPIGGRRDHSEIRARLLASLTRTQTCRILFLRSIRPDTPTEIRRRAETELRGLARDEAEGEYDILLEEADDAVEAILRHADEVDLIVLGVNQATTVDGVFGTVVRTVAEATDKPLLLIGRPRRRPARTGWVSR